MKLVFITVDNSVENYIDNYFITL